MKGPLFSVLDAGVVYLFCCHWFRNQNFFGEAFGGISGPMLGQSVVSVELLAAMSAFCEV